jgi:hypothetical protein
MRGSEAVSLTKGDEKVETKRIAGIVLIVVGIILLLLSLTADLLGVGTSPGVFGWRQIVGVAVGAIAAVAGLILALRK